MVKSLIDFPELSRDTHDDNRKLWMAAIKFPMYSVASGLIATGTAVAYRNTGEINWSMFLKFTFLLYTVFMAVVPPNDEQKALLSKECRNLLSKWANMIFDQKCIYALFLR